tara:strand:- start:3307 stop:3867 length:561 start_codon:yes stop_codon:yes gene_type:complete
MKQKSRVHSAMADVPEYASSALESSYPHVEQSVLDRIYALDRRFQVYWELQGSGDFRWHIMKHLTDSLTDDPHSIYLVQNRDGSYAPMDVKVVVHMQKVCWLNRDIKRFVKTFQEEEARIAEIKDKDAKREGEALAGELKSIVARLAWAQGNVSVDPGWGVGYSSKADGSLEAGAGPKSRIVTKAI